MSESLRTVILQELKSRFPGITWKLGSLVRELIVEPLASLGDVFDTYIQKAENSLDIITMCQSPAQYSAELDTWMTRLGITQPEAKASKGFVSILSETGEDMTIDEGTVFTWGDDLSLQVTETVVISSLHPYTKLSEGAYLIEVPVESTGEYGATLSSGSPLNWSGAPSHVYDIYTSSPISGGRSTLTDQDKATLILNMLSIKSFSGSECIARALQREFPDDIVDAAAGTKEAKAPYVVNLYVKPHYPPAAFTLQVGTENVDGQIKVTIPGAGVIEIVKVMDRFNTVCPITDRAVKNTLGDSNSTVTLTLDGVKAGEVVTVYCNGFQVLSDCASWLSAEQQGLPFTFVTKVPAVAIIGLAINTTDNVPVDVKTVIQSYIGGKPLDAALTDGEISAILQQYSITVTGSHVYTATLLNDSGEEAMATSVGGISPSGNLWAAGRPVAMYSYINKIRANV